MPFSTQAIRLVPSPLPALTGKLLQPLPVKNMDVTAVVFNHQLSAHQQPSCERVLARQASERVAGVDIRNQVKHQVSGFALEWKLIRPSISF
jgi:hypothetical protein